MNTSSPSQQHERTDTHRYKGCLLTIFLVLFCMIFWWKVIKFPPQIFGTSRDHFKAHVIRPIPASVQNIKAAFDDLIIHPDVIYCFRFTVSREDIKKIIDYRSLQQVFGDEDVRTFTNVANGLTDACPYGSELWWNEQKLSQLETYQYYDQERRGLAIALWYDESMSEAYYIFVTM